MEKETTLVQPIVTGESAQAEGTPVPAEEFAAPLGSAISEEGGTDGKHTTETDDNSVKGSGRTDGDDIVTEPDKTSMRQNFEKLIKGEYKEFYEERIKENLNRRFKENAKEKKRNEENSKIVELLLDRYDVKEGDTEGLLKALESDDAYLAAQADKRGIGIDDYKYIKRLEAENRRHIARQAHFEAERKANEAVEKWYAESESIKQTYPEFDIFAEVKNPAFVSLLQKGIDTKTAYEVIHHNDLVELAAQNAAREAEKKTTEAIRQRAMRPAENGLSSKSSAIYGNAVSSLTREEREDIARRASRGERISF